jgi:hypothetical protein
LLCFAFVAVSLFGGLLCLYDTFVQFSLHSGKDGQEAEQLKQQQKKNKRRGP